MKVWQEQFFLLILHEKQKFKKLNIKLEWKAFIWYHEKKTFYIFKIDQQITELWHFEFYKGCASHRFFLLIFDKNLKFKK